MDRYAEMLTEIEHSDHPLQTIQTLQRMVCTVCEAGPAVRVFCGRRHFWRPLRTIETPGNCLY